MDRFELQRLLSIDRDGELAPQDRARLEQALRDEPSAIEDRAWFTAIGEAIRTGADPAVPRGMQERILARVRREAAPEAAASPTPPVAPAPLLFLRRSALVAAAVLLVVGLVHVGRLPDGAIADDSTPVDSPIDYSPSPELRQVLDERDERDEDRAPELLQRLLGRGGDDG